MKHNLATASSLFSGLHVRSSPRKSSIMWPRIGKSSITWPRLPTQRPDHKCDQQQLRGELADKPTSSLNCPLPQTHPVQRNAATFGDHQRVCKVSSTPEECGCVRTMSGSSSGE